MLNPTFASFKTSKPAPTQSTYSTHQPFLAEISLNIQPKTFHELKASANLKNHHQPQDNRSNMNLNLEDITNKLGFTHHNHHANQLRKTPTNQGLRKNYSEYNIAQSENRMLHGQSGKSKPKINTKNYMTAKKNLVQVQRHSKGKTISRPIITGPSLLKNKSFIYPYTSEGKQNFTMRPSNDRHKATYNFAQDFSIDSIDKKSDEINLSIESSNGDKQTHSFLSSSKFDDSLNLKYSCNSSKIDDKTLNFSRKSNKTIFKGDLGKIKFQNDVTNLGEISSLSLMARQMKSSCQSQSQSNENLSKKSKNEKSSINFSKKFQYYKRLKQQELLNKPSVITIEQFQFIEQIGEGKYGKVYMARHRFTNFLCALKTISKAKIKQENIQQPLIREIKIQMYLNHPNIVKLYGCFHDRQNLYLIMECCISGHLLKLIKHRKIFEETQILDIISNVYEAVCFLHCHGIIHRDLKPENVVIQNGVYKICDFGWAAYAKGDTRTTFCGTPLYVCPQVLKGNEYDSKADVWGLGVLTYELAYGRVPFPIWNQTDMMKIIKDPVYFPTWTSVSQKMQNLIKQMLNKDPVKRLSLNQILSSPLISQYARTRISFRSQVQSLF